MPTKNALRPATSATSAALPLLAFTAAAVLMGACGRVPGQFIVLHNQVPATGTTCTIPGDLGTNYNPEGVLDVSLVNEGARSGYLLFPLLENDLPAPTNGQLVDGNRIALQGFNVHIELAAASDLAAAVFAENPRLIDYFVATSGTVASGGGRTAAIVNAFPADLALALRDRLAVPEGSFLEVTTRVEARGERLTGNIQSDSFSFPLRLCEGCLIASVQNCPVRAMPTNLGNPCNIAQDVSVDCCVGGGGLVCPSVVSAQ